VFFVAVLVGTPAVAFGQTAPGLQAGKIPALAVFNSREERWRRLSYQKKQFIYPPGIYLMLR
jgi:hypothetical protein